MKISPTKTYAVLTGDMVDSSKLPKAERQALPEKVKQAGRETQKAFADAVPLAVDVFRGDSWQLLTTDPVRSLRIALFFRAQIRAGRERGRGLDTRVSIGTGAIDFVPRKAVSEGDGEAYRLSGHGLEALPRGRFLSWEPVPGGTLSLVGATVGLIDALAQGWTNAQAQAVAGALCGWTHEKIAAALAGKITRQAVTKHLNAGHWEAIEAALNAVEAELRKVFGNL
jgi:hypothetical protein